MYSAFVMRYLHKIDEADTKTVDAYEEVLQNLFKRMSELEIDLYRCPGNTIDNLKPKEDGGAGRRGRRCCVGSHAPNDLKYRAHLSYYKNLFTHRGCGCGCTLDVLL